MVKISIRQIALSASFAAAALFSALPASGEEAPLVRVSYAVGPRLDSLARLDGSFEKATNAKVTWVTIQSSADILNLFAANELDIARLGSSAVAAGIANKLPIEVAGIEAVISTNERLVARKPIDSVKGLEGKTVAYPAGSTAHYALEIALDLNGVDRSKVKQVSLPPAEIVAAWTRGDIDAAYVWGPFFQKLESDNGQTLLTTKDLQKDGVLLFNNFGVRKAFAEKYPEIVAAYLKTYQEKIDEYKKDPEAVAQFLSKELKLPIETARATLGGLDYPTLKEQLDVAFIGQGSRVKDGRAAQSLKNSAEFLAGLGEIKKSAIPDSYAPYINTRFLEEAVKE